MPPTTLVADFEKAYKDTLSFKGKFHNFSSNPRAPNPRLTFDGVTGPSSWPLKESDAKNIISKHLHATSETGPVVIDASKVSFGDANWHSFVETVLSQAIRALGVADNTAQRPRLELLHATLHRPGTSTPLSLEAPKNPAAFATLTIVLPSHYSGGKVEFPAGKDRPSTVYDTSKNASTTTSFIACYYKVPTVVQPVTSGCRLALVYNIVHTSPNTPKPTIPDEKAVFRAFRTIFQNWRDGKYTAAQQPKIPIVAWVLRSKSVDVGKGLAGLTNRSDAGLAKLLLLMAKDLGFSVCLAKLNRTVVGLPSEHHFAHNFIPQHQGPFRNDRYNAPRYTGRGWQGLDDSGESENEDYEFMAEMAEMEKDYFEGDYDTPDMGEIESEVHSLEELKRIDGGAMSMDFGAFFIAGANLASSDFFKDIDPDEEEFDRTSGEITLEFQRPALVIYRTSEESDLFLAAKGPNCYLRQFDLTGEASTRATEIVNAALSQLESGEVDKSPLTSSKLLGFSMASQPLGREGIVSIQKILAIAISWNQASLWNRAISLCPQVQPTDLAPMISNGVTAFGITPIKDGLSALVKSTKGFDACLKILRSIPGADAQGLTAHEPWMSEVLQGALNSCTRPTLNDVAAILSLVKENGLKYLVTFVENIEKVGTYEAVLALVNGLEKQRNLPTGSDQERETLGAALKICLTIASSQWEERLYVNSQSTNDKIARICNIVVSCLAIDDLQPCADLLNGLFHFDANMDIISRLRDIHGPLISRLKSTLATLNKPRFSLPFGLFYRRTISSYLSHGLPARTVLADLPPTVIDCACADCVQLNTFLTTTGMKAFEASRSGRAHVESQIRERGSFLEAYITTKLQRSGSRQSLIIGKRPEVFDTDRWNLAKMAAKEFVTSICNDEDGLRQVMGERYDDVVAALDGTKAYAPDDFTITHTPLTISNGDPVASLIGAKRPHNDVS